MGYRRIAGDFLKGGLIIIGATCQDAMGGRKWDVNPYSPAVYIERSVGFAKENVRKVSESEF